MIKQPDKDGTITQAYIVEVTGPILPFHTQSIISLYHKTQQADFRVVYNNHDITAPFNVLGTLSDTNVNDKDSTNILQDHDNSRKVEQTWTQFFKHKSISENICAIKEIVCTPNGFTWTS